MAKRKSPKELMASRNPLTRTAVTPVDIYSQAQPPVTEVKPEQNSKPHTDEQTKKPIFERKVHKDAEVKKPKQDNEPVVPYSTYLSPEKIKKIKWRALERDTKDYRIVQEAIDEYFERHSDT